MAYVCADWFPLTDDPKDRRKEPGFYMEDTLKMQLDFLLKNVVNDWDFTIIICGAGRMRVGKSVMGMQVGSYWTYQVWKLYGIIVPFNIKENIVFNGQDLMPKGNKLGQNHKYAVLQYDEAADDLEGTKVMTAATQAIKDYLRKSAQYNMLNIIVQAEFFEIPKPIALSRSIFMINVYYIPNETGLFERGYADFYSSFSKKKLYLLGKKELNYNAVKPDFRFTFRNFYTLDEKEYKKEKFDSLQRWKKYTGRELRLRGVLRAFCKEAHARGLSYVEIAELVNKNSDFKISYMYIQRSIKGEEDLDEELQ